MGGSGAPQRGCIGLALSLWAVGFAVLIAGDPVGSMAHRFLVIFPLNVGYTLAFAPIVIGRLSRAVSELEGVDRFSVPLQIAASAGGVAMHALMATLTPSSDQDVYLPVMVLARFESLLMWILAAPITLVLLRSLWLLRRLGRGARVNLLDATPLEPFGQAASLVALYFGGVVAIGILSRTALSFLVGGSTYMGQAPVVATTLFTLMLVAAVYLPLSGARLSIRAAKRRELDRVAEHVGHHSDVLDSRDGPERANQLMAYQERIRRVPEWPFALGTAPRAIFYIALPLLSWIAAALVERALGVLLE